MTTLTRQLDNPLGTIFGKKAFASYKKVVQFLAFHHYMRYFCSGVCLIEIYGRNNGYRQHPAGGQHC